MTKQLRILLIGDSCFDEYYYGVCERLSPEAPVPILKITRMESKAGMAANVLSNLEALGCDVDFMTGSPKSLKKRFIDEKSKQHILRVDDDRPSKPFNPEQRSLSFIQYDAIVFSDYNKGFISYEAIKSVREKYRGPIFVDSKKRDLAQFEGCYVKVNQLEFDNSTSQPSDLIVTQGDQGATYQGQTYPSEPAEVVDVCGAGDTFLAALAVQYLNTRDISAAIKFANKASAIAVSHSGVYTLTRDDIEKIK